MESRFVPRSPSGARLAERREVVLTVAERRHASNVRVFGSVARGEDARDSDIDLIVDLDPMANPLDLLELGCDLEDELDQGIVFDACRARLIEIGEAAKNIEPDLLASFPDVRWRAIARMRDRLAHHYFDTDHAVVDYVVREELTPLRSAVVRLIDNLASPDVGSRGHEPC